jgi:hypothetical protein
MTISIKTNNVAIAAATPARVKARAALLKAMMAADKAAGAATASVATYCDTVAATFNTFAWVATPAGKAELAALVAIAKAKNYGGIDKNGKPGNGAYVLVSRVKAKAAALLESDVRNTAATAAHRLANAATPAEKKAAETASKIAEAAVKALVPAKPKGKKEAKPTPPVKVVSPETNAMVAATTLKRLLVVKKDEAGVAFTNAQRVELSKLSDLIAAFLAATA